ncbi:MAG: hypothetical protein JST31_15435 [Actinobacteria bacterium]|nr:hypothetical protein [Actinomycetota bacterium]
MDDLGEQISYLTLGHDVPVYASGGERVGKVVRVLSEPAADMFDGIIIDTTAGPGGHKFVDAPEVGQIHERGVVLKIDAAEAARLPKPEANPGAITVGPSDLVAGRGPGFFRRTWDRLSGK